MYETELKIPRDRVAVLIGRKGATKRKIQTLTNAKIRVSKEGDVSMITEDTVGSYLITPIIRAIGRGVNPDVALELVNENIVLEIVNMPDFTGKSPEKLKRMKARLIGTQGKARYVMEKFTNTTIVVYGKTVAIVGKVDDVAIAQQAVEKMLNGAPHANMYNFIKAQYRHLKTFEQRA
ncbi:MAG: KH domain-containing protein [Nanoarchaeota archaeon]|mgnify:CR=1 FL=1